MRFVEPSIFHIAQTTLDHEGLQDYLNALGVPDWTTDAESDEEELIEVCGKLCYRSFDVKLNENLTKVTEADNTKYIGNILNQKHGRVIEPASDTYIFMNVSRIMTHELVRHIAGVTFSQESMRYVRLNDIPIWFPKALAEHPRANDLKLLFEIAVKQSEQNVKAIYDIVGINDMNAFTDKKKYTSAARRLAPDGIATSIAMTANARAWRYVIEARTNRHAEEEIRLAVGKVYLDLVKRYPNIYQDSTEETVDGLLEIKFKNSKV